MFVLLMLFLFKYIDDLIGKGFAWYIIARLMLYASVANVSEALPLSILLSTIMTYGSLGENYELVAIKSAGISLSRAMYPMLVVVTFLSIGAFIFSDYMLPVVNYKYLSLLYDVGKQKSATLLPEGVFSSSFPGYTIRVEKKDPDGIRLYGITIYQPNKLRDNNTVTHAREGRNYRTPGDQYLVIKLKDGVRYEESSPDGTDYNPRQTFQRTRFKDAEVKLALSGFSFHRTDESQFRSVYQMENLKELKSFSDSSQQVLDHNLALNYKAITPFVKYFSPSRTAPPSKVHPTTIAAPLSLSQQSAAVANAINEVRWVQQTIQMNNEVSKSIASEIRKSKVEYQKKFTLSVVCIVLFLIGAPLGAIIRRGGLGLPVVISVAFFLIYHIISSIGETSVKNGTIPVILGMWVAIFILTPIGLFLSYKAANDSVMFDNDAYKRFYNKIFKYKASKPAP